MSQRRNTITDVPGLKVGNAARADIMTGVSVLMGDRPLIGAVDVRGGGPGTRDTQALSLSGSVDEVHAVVLAGGSAFGLSAATGVQCWLAENEIGYRVGNACVPIVPQAILFDLANGGNKQWGSRPPYEQLAREACQAAAVEFAQGSAGAGYGATCCNLRGGLGSASEQLEEGVIVGALAAVNPVGCVTIGDTPHFWAAPLEREGEFGGRGLPDAWPPSALDVRLKGSQANNTTIAIVATNAKLDKRHCMRLAIMAQTGMARAIYPVHSPLDGDIVFGLATGELAIDPLDGLTRLGAAAANCLSRAIARGVFLAEPAPAGWVGPPAWQTEFGNK